MSGRGGIAAAISRRCGGHCFGRSAGRAFAASAWILPTATSSTSTGASRSARRRSSSSSTGSKAPRAPTTCRASVGRPRRSACGRCPELSLVQRRAEPQPRLYHSGETSDLDAVLGRLIAREPAVRARPGRRLARRQRAAEVARRARAERVRAGAGGAAPSRRRSTWRRARARLDAGLPRALHAELSRHHEAEGAGEGADLLRVAHRPRRALRRARTFAEYDRAVTAPMFGFADERDYWARSSSRPFLPRHPAPGAPDQRGQRSLRAAGGASGGGGRRLALARGGLRAPRAATRAFSRARGAAARGPSAGRWRSCTATCPLLVVETSSETTGRAMQKGPAARRRPKAGREA